MLFKPFLDQTGGNIAIYFVDAPIEKIASDFRRSSLLHSLLGLFFGILELIRIKRLRGDRNSAIEALFPLKEDKILLMETDSKYVAAMWNFKWGWAYGPLERSILKWSKADMVLVNISGFSEQDDGLFIREKCLCWYNSKLPENEMDVRTISIWDEEGDGKLTFESKGPCFPFEKPEYYQKHKIEDRFPTDLFLDYLEHSGIRLFDDSFYLPNDSSKALLIKGIKS